MKASNQKILYFSTSPD